MNQLKLCWFVVVLSYITMRQNIAQPSEGSGDDPGRSLSPHHSFKPGTYFEPVIFNQIEKLDLVKYTYKVTG